MVRRGEGSVIKTVIGGGGKGIGQTEQSLATKECLRAANRYIAKLYRGNRKTGS